MRDSITLQPEPSSAGEARLFVAEHTHGVLPDEVTEVAVLLTSELVTNVIVHARTPMRLSVDVDSSALRVALADEVSRAPVRRASEGIPRLTGRGMHLVEELSNHWGVEPTPAGKTVWFELSA
ncbi:MAG TPA: ATP-binding protein [Frankiaceae bacterium]|nr:ATP-binding protein [Frankiaceae bacterium]